MPLTTVSPGMLDTTAQYYSFKNRIINGAMVIDQRNAGASVSVNGAYTVDRWKMFLNGGGIFSAQQSTTVPNNNFTNSVVLTVTTPDASIGASDFYAYNQEIEGFNTADFGWGTSSATSVTLSFWVRSSIAGLYCVSLYNSAGNRGYPATYTISNANTWQFISVTIPGPDASVGGTWQTGNLAGIIVRFDLGSGSDGNATANTWKTTGTFAANRTTSTTNWIATNGATFYITGVQLEKGSTATSFDYRPYGTELALCQRYFFANTDGANACYLNGYGNTPASNAIGTYSLPVPARATPTVSIVSSVNGSAFSAGAANKQSIYFSASVTGSSAPRIESFTSSAEL